MKDKFDPPTVSRRQFIKSAGAAAVGVVGACAFEGYSIERNMFQITRFHHSGAGVSKPLKIAFMSDFHRSYTTSRAFLERAVATCMSEAPDVVLLGGDYISSAADRPFVGECAEVFSKLDPPGGTFYVMGNHDNWCAASLIREAYKAAHIEELTNTNTRLADGVHLFGLDDHWTGHPDPDRAFKGVDSGVRIGFSHNPRIFPLVRDRSCLLVCGHTHGGQINIPLVPNPCLRGWNTYISGWFHEGNSSMYVNRGIGTLSLPIRFRCPPEITIITVGPA